MKHRILPMPVSDKSQNHFPWSPITQNPVKAVKKLGKIEKNELLDDLWPHTCVILKRISRGFQKPFPSHDESHSCRMIDRRIVLPSDSCSKTAQSSKVYMNTRKKLRKVDIFS